MRVVRLQAVALAALLLLSGCSFIGGNASPTPTPAGATPTAGSPTATATLTASPTPDLPTTSTPTPTPSPTSTGESNSTPGIRITIIRVIDGDTVIAQDDEGDTGRIRLIGIDAPERFNGTDPEEFGVANTSTGRACLRNAGNESAAYLRELALDKEVELRPDDMVPNRGPFGRYFGYLYRNETNLNHELVRAGHARVFNDEFTNADAFYESEAAAQTDNLGLWTCQSVNGTTTTTDSLDTSSLPE